MTKLVVDQAGYQVEGRQIWHDISFELHDGDWVTVVGPSGGGKSTLLKAIAGLQDITEGHIFLNDEDVMRLPIGDYRQQVSYATQSAQLFGETVRDNLDLPYLVRQQTPNEQQQIAGLEQMDLPADYLDKAVTELSGGERQRVGVLRNLLFPPKVLLLDEISTGLDAETKQVIWRAIHALHARERLIVLLVTHDEGEIADAQDILTIQNGEGARRHEQSN